MCGAHGELRKGDGRKKLFCAVLVVPKLCIKCNYIFLLGLLEGPPPQAPKQQTSRHIPWSLGEGCRFFKCSEQGFGFEIRMLNSARWVILVTLAREVAPTPLRCGLMMKQKVVQVMKRKRQEENVTCAHVPPHSFIQHPHHPQPPPIAMDLPSPSSCFLWPPNSYLIYWSHAIIIAAT